jgi:hypothetical protein
VRALGFSPEGTKSICATLVALVVVAADCAGGVLVGDWDAGRIST